VLNARLFAALAGITLLFAFMDREHVFGRANLLLSVGRFAFGPFLLAAFRGVNLRSFRVGLFRRFSFDAASCQPDGRTREFFPYRPCICCLADFELCYHEWHTESSAVNTSLCTDFQFPVGVAAFRSEYCMGSFARVGSGPPNGSTARAFKPPSS